MAEERHLDALNRYWNAVARGEAPPPSDLDPEITGALDWALARDDAPGPDPAFVARLEEKMLHSLSATEVLPSDRPFGLNGTRSSPRGRLFRTTLPVEREYRPWHVAQFATAAVLLLALGLGAVALGRGWWSGPDRRDTIPAAVAPATPTPETTEELLLEITLPAEAMPRGEQVSSGLGHFSIPPGTRSTWEAEQPYCCPGPLVEHVVAGAYTVRAEAPVRVVRAGGAVEEVPAGVEVVLQPGDALVSRNETVVEAANTGDVPVELLNWNLVDDPSSFFNGHRLPGWVEHEIDVKSNWSSSGPYGLSVPAGAATVRLRRVDLEPEATFPGPPDGGTQFTVSLGQNAAATPVPGFILGRQFDGTITNVGRAAGTAYVLTLEPADPGESGSPTP